MHFFYGKGMELCVGDIAAEISGKAEIQREKKYGSE